MNLQAHIKVSGQQISPYVLLPGDPSRVDVIGTYLNDFSIIASNREFRVGIGTFHEKRITVCSTGIGCPSTAIAVEELINAGAKYIIRVGTCGGAWRSDIPVGSLIIPMASIRDEGTTIEYLPQGFPAVADFDIVNELVRSAEKEKTKYFIGINRTHDAFYGTQVAITKWGEYLRNERWKNLETPILSSEMESAALFVIASIRGCKAGAIFAVNANPEPLKNRILNKEIEVITESTEDMTKQTVVQMINVALETMSTLP